MTSCGCLRNNGVRVCVCARVRFCVNTNFYSEGKERDFLWLECMRVVYHCLRVSFFPVFFIASSVHDHNVSTVHHNISTVHA